MDVLDATQVRKPNGLKRTCVKPTSVTSSDVMPDGRGALFSYGSNINPFFYLWFPAFVACVTFSFVYKIIQSSGLLRQPVVSHCCLASIHELETIRRTERLANYRQTHTLRLYPPWWISFVHSWFKHFKVDWSVCGPTGLTLMSPNFAHTIYICFPCEYYKKQRLFPLTASCEWSF